nr:hypothetical protein [Tanacetum cinerariifolium]
MNMDQDRQMLMVDDNVGNQYGNGNVVTAPADGNGNGINDDSDGSIEVPKDDNCYNNEIFNMFTQEELYSELFEPILKPHQVLQNDSNVISEAFSVEQGGGTIEQHPATVEETRTYHESVFHNLAAEVEKVNSVNRKMKKTNVELTTELARYKNQEKCFEISQEKYDKLERSNGSKLSWEISRVKERILHVDTLDPLPQKLENENVELEFQVQNFEKENAHLKTAYKNLFDSINVTRTQNKIIIDSLQTKLHDTIYENAKLRAPLFDKVSEQKNTTKGMNTNTKFANQSTERKPYLQTLRNTFVYMNGMKSRKKDQSTNVSKSVNQKKYKANVKKSKKLGSKESLALPSKPISFLRWLPTGRIFNLCGKITSSSIIESESNTYVFETPEAEFMYLSASCHLSTSSQNQRDLPRNTPLDRVEVLDSSFLKFFNFNTSSLQEGRTLEPVTFTSIFKFHALKQLAIKRWDDYGFVIHPGLVGVTCKSVRIDM